MGNPGNITKKKNRFLSSNLTPAGMLCWALLLLFASSASAQVSTTLFTTGVSAPGGGLVLNGSAINPNTGQPFRHLWSADSVNGLCRVDPDIDTAGSHAINTATCITTVVGGVVFNSGNLAFDAVNNNIYAVDANGKLGIFRLHYLPGGDNGFGLIDPIQQEVLGGSTTGGKTVGACGISGNVPTSVALGPDSNLYVGFAKTGNIMRILAPQTEPLPCGNVQSDIASTPDLRTDHGLAWAGHNLIGNDSHGAFTIQNADQCFAPQNNFTPCPAPLNTIRQAVTPTLVISDQPIASTTGNNLYFANSSSVTAMNGVSNTSTETITQGFGGTGFQFISALAIDYSDPANPVLYVGDDPSNGLTPGAGRWFQVGNPPAATAPGVPTHVTATAGNAQATVSWSPAAGATATSYTVHNSFASNGVTVADVVVSSSTANTAAPTSITITGLTNGVSYQFEVSASNAQGSSAFSAASNTVTPQAPTVPGAPTGVVANAGDGSASVVWTAPASNGGSAISSYTVTALVGGAPAGISVTVSGTATAANVVGLTNGTTYTFTVHATNALGNGPESVPSNAVTPAPAPATPDVGVNMSGPASVNAGTNAVYTLSIANLGPGTAPQVVVTDNIPANGATFVSSTASQGTCSAAGTTLTCNLGTMAAGGSATVAVTLNLTAQTTNTASVKALDAAGNLLNDPNPGNNSASVTTSVLQPPPPNGTTTDIQVVGSAQNGGPAVGTIDTFTWQIRNNQGSAANGVTFTNQLPQGLGFASVHTSLGTCTAPAPGTMGATITCNVSSLPGGQSFLVTVNATTPVAGSMATTGSATFNGTDTNPANNSFTVVIGVR